MTSFKQIEANRRNARKSTGPITEEGKQRSRCNAIRHGLTAETVIGALEDAEDYKAFEAAIIADYDAQSAVERELVLRLASLLWRLRRATTMETGLFEIQAASEWVQAGPPTSPGLSRVCLYVVRASLLGRCRTRSRRAARDRERNRQCRRNLSNLALILPPTSPVAFCASRICPTTRSTASADMKELFGVKLGRFCLRLMPWIAANQRIEGAASVLAGRQERPAYDRNEC